MLACTSLERGFCDLEGPELATGSASFFRSHTLLLDAVCCPNTCKKSARSSGTPAAAQREQQDKAEHTNTSFNSPRGGRDRMSAREHVS